jgi:hypothetical protein
MENQNGVSPPPSPLEGWDPWDETGAFDPITRFYDGAYYAKRPVLSHVRRPFSVRL